MLGLCDDNRNIYVYIKIHHRMFTFLDKGGVLKTKGQGVSPAENHAGSVILYGGGDKITSVNFHVLHCYVNNKPFSSVQCNESGV